MCIPVCLVTKGDEECLSRYRDTFLQSLPGSEFTSCSGDSERSGRPIEFNLRLLMLRIASYGNGEFRWHAQWIGSWGCWSRSKNELFSQS